MKLNNFLRWVGFLPGAVVCATLACAIFLLFSLLADFLTGDLGKFSTNPELFAIEHFFTSFIISAIFGYCFVYFGASIAPREKKRIAFVLFVLITIVFGFLLVFSLVFLPLSNSWRLAVNSILCIAAAVAAAYAQRNH